MTAIAPFKVTQGHGFWYRSKACDFLWVNNTKLCSISHRFRVITVYWSNYCLFYQGCLYLTHSLGVNLWTLDYEVCPHKLETSLSCGAQNISIYWTVQAWTTSSVTDGRTDRITIAIRRDKTLNSKPARSRSTNCHTCDNSLRVMIRTRRSVGTWLYPDQSQLIVVL